MNCSTATHKFRKKEEKWEKKDFVAKWRKTEVLGFIFKDENGKNAFYIRFLLPYVFTTLGIPYIVHTIDIFTFQ